MNAPKNVAKKAAPKDVLALEDFSGMSEKEIKEKIVADFEIAEETLRDTAILIAYMSEGSYGCDSDAFIVFRKDGVLYEVQGSHCSCFGFEGQWEPDPLESIEAVLKRSDWALAGGGYDSDQKGNAAKIREALTRIGGAA